jgi:hypothetical protein
MYVELAILAVVGLFAAVFISTSFLEKQVVRDFVPVTPDTPALNQPYFAAMNDVARQLGFIPAGEFRQHRNSKVYQARLALWVSTDGQLLVRVGGGKTAGLTIRRTTVTSFVEPGRIVETMDEFSTTDLTGLTDQEVVLNADLLELLGRHLARLALYPGSRRIFTPQDGLAAYEAMQAMRAVEMERQGLGRFVNAERSVWRHTWKGAWLSCSKGLKRQMAEGKVQQHRIHKQRPGDQ